MGRPLRAATVAALLAALMAAAPAAAAQLPELPVPTRDGAMFGLGYAAAEDRLFFMDALRNAGRGQLSTFAGGANTAQDAEQREVTP